jgi:hypothetical protein
MIYFGIQSEILLDLICELLAPKVSHNLVVNFLNK